MTTQAGPEDRNFQVAAIGELLWDLLPQGPRLGGAPANFIAMSAALGQQAYLISCVGEDNLGQRAIEELGEHGVLVNRIYRDASLPTGTVTVTLDPISGPSYRIHENVAWDQVPDSPALVEFAPTLDAICFGTLAQRSAATRGTLRHFVQQTRPDCLRVFDVNLRAPFWTEDMLAWGCSHATILKMNDDEVPLVARALGAPAHCKGLLECARFILDRFEVRLIAITRGENGSLLATREEVQEHPGISTRVADTVGAGDAFTAALTRYASLGGPLATMADAANRWGAWVASQPGGMPCIDDRTRRSISEAIV